MLLSHNPREPGIEEMAGALHIGQVDTVALDLECGSCHAKFRITPSDDTVRARTIDCMRCGNPLEVPAYDAQRGWKRAAPGSVFHRYRSELPAPLLESEALDAPAPKRALPEKSSHRAEREVAPEQPRERRFAFETFVPGNDAPTPEREVDAQRTPKELAPDPSGRDEDLDLLLDKARELSGGKRTRRSDDEVSGSADRDDVASSSSSSVIEDASRPTTPLSRETLEEFASQDAIDVTFEPFSTDPPSSLEEDADADVSTSAENEDRELERPNALGLPEFLPAFEPEPDHFELQIGEQVIGPLDATSVHALLAGGLHGVARVRLVGESGWRALEDHEVFGIFFDGVDADAERTNLAHEEPEDAEILLGDEDEDEDEYEDALDEVFFNTLPLAALSQNAQPSGDGLATPSEILRAPPIPADALSEVIEDGDDATENSVEEDSGEILLDDEIELVTSPLNVELAAIPDDDSSEVVEESSPNLEPEQETFELDRDRVEALKAEDLRDAPEEAVEDTTGTREQDRPEPNGSSSSSFAEPIAPPLPAREPMGRGARILIAIAVLALVVGAFVAGDRFSPLTKQLDRDASPIATAKEAAPMIELEPSKAGAQAVSTAQTMVKLAVRQDWQSRSRQREVASSLLDENDAQAASKIFGHLWLAEPKRDGALALLYAKSLLAIGQFSLAREVAVEGRLLASASSPAASSEGVEKVFHEAVEKDPALHPETRTIIPDKEIDQIRALGGGKSVSFKLRKDGKNLYAFKPAQTEWGEGWRSEIAAYLMCEALSCNFNIPESLPARISREHFDELYGRHTSPKQSAYKNRFGELTWVTEKGPDGQEREYLYGVIKEWVPGFVEWPIEYQDTWRSLVDSEQKLSNLDRSFNAAFASLRIKQQRKYWFPISREREGVTTREIARGLSSLTLFDFLTNNWDRYSQVEAYYGVNNHFKDGQFLSLDNGAAFHLQAMLVTRQRFAIVSRFSERFVTGIRMMRPEQFDPIFFPSGSKEARTRLEVFWSQREKALARIDELVEERGEDKVLCFE